MKESVKQNFDGGIIYPEKDWQKFLEIKGVTQETIQYVLRAECSDDFKIEDPEGVLRICKEKGNKEESKEALRAIALARNTTTIIIEDVCNGHKDHVPGKTVQQWSDVKKRGHHTFGDTLGECFAELYEEESNIVQFYKK